MTAALLLSTAALVVTPLHAQVLLVTEQEAIASREAPEPMITARAVPVPDAPRIELLAPDLGGGAVASPIRIVLRFQPTQPAAIRPETFKVMYGSFRIDITGRITSAARVSAEGIDVAEAALPKGSHKLLIEIRDSAGRTGERLLQFLVD